MLLVRRSWTGFSILSGRKRPYTALSNTDSTKRMRHLVIIGNGITGTTVARWVRKMSDDRITVVSSESEHFFSRPALMYIYMGHMTYAHTKPYEDWFWKKNQIHLVKAQVKAIDTVGRTLRLHDGSDIPYDRLVLATGSTTQMYGWPGQNLEGVCGLVTLQDLEAIEKYTTNITRAVIVGGGLIGVELAEMLISRRIPITFLVREQEYWDNVLPAEEARLIGRHIREHGIDLRLATQLKEIRPGRDGRVESIVTDRDETIPCQFVGITTGVRPRIDVVQGSCIEVKHGILVNEYLETNVPGIYAAGDCAEFREPKARHPRVEQLWYTGRMQAEALAKTICGIRTAYDRGIWFNSAKFFNIEYQTYGMVSNTPRPEERSFYWEDERRRCAVRLVFRVDDLSLVGLNAFGIRMRQDVCHAWIRDMRSVDYVIEHLAEANFDPEFFRRHEQTIVAAYNRQEGKELMTRGRKGLSAYALPSGLEDGPWTR